MTRHISPKKTETIEVRLPYEAKVAFMALCRDDGRTASEAVRWFIDSELDARPRPAGVRHGAWRALAAAIAGLMIGTVAAPSLAQPSPASHLACERLDFDRDGLLSFEEFRRR